MAKKKYIPTEKHHRRPKSLGGTDDPGNIALVLPSEHRHWHTLFGNVNAMQICELINEHHAPPKKIVVCEFINGNKVEVRGQHELPKTDKRAVVWTKLFKKMRFNQIIDYINSTWIDPSYHLRTKSR